MSNCHNEAHIHSTCYAEAMRAIEYFEVATTRSEHIKTWTRGVVEGCRTMAQSLAPSAYWPEAETWARLLKTVE